MKQENLLLSLMALVFVFLQCSQPKQLNAQPNQQAPQIIIKQDTSIKVGLSDLKINVQVVGNIATTTMDMNFYNGLDRILEGELNFPLGDGQTVSRFAMDVNGKLREGVVVEKNKGRKAFETIVRRQVDPGLLEMTKGNNFKARVYPIPAKGYKRIVIAYEQELPYVSDELLYQLPLTFKDKVNFAIEVEVLHKEKKPIFKQNELANFRFEKWQEAFIAKFEKKEYVPNQSLSFVIPPAENKSIEVATETYLDEKYFYINTEIPMIRRQQKLPEKILLAWDVSNSAKGRNLEKELDVLDAFFKKTKKIEVQLKTFSNTIHSNEKFIIKNGNWKKLRALLESQSYDGGTQLGCLNFGKIMYDAIFLSTDGISNFGQREIVTGKNKIYTINSFASGDPSYLKYLAQKSGGIYLSLTSLKIQDAANLLGTDSYQFISAEFDNNKIYETYPNIKTPVSDRFALAGKLKGEAATIQLNFGFGNEILHTETVNISWPKEKGIPTNVSRIWAQKKLAELDLQYEKNESEIAKLGKDYGIVTRNTSLIVLDDIADYVEYEILPPEELQKEYYKILEQKQKESADRKAKQLRALTEDLSQRKTWWNTVFATKEPKVKPIEKSMPSTFRTDEIISSAPPPPAVEEAEIMLDNVVISDSDEDGMADVLDAEPETEPSGNVVATEVAPETKAKGEIKLNDWNPDAPYLKELEGSKIDYYKKYLMIRDSFAQTASFYLDITQFFIKNKNKKTALRILSNIAEMELENHELLRILGHKLRQMEELDLAIQTFKYVEDIREEEPQTYRDLATAYADMGLYQLAANNLYKVITTDWESNENRFAGIKGIALHELNTLINLHKDKINTSDFDEKLLYEMPVDVRVVLNWSNDNSDVDLWVTDPWGIKCFYSNKETPMGGRISNDMTRGYGPEEFLLKKAIEGDYKIQANFYGDSRQKVAGNVTLQVQFFTNYGRPNQKREEVTIKLSGKKEVVDVGSFIFKK